MTDLATLDAAFRAASTNRDYAEWPSHPTFAFAHALEAVLNENPYALSQRFKGWAQDNLAMFETLLFALFEREDLRLPTVRVLARDLDFWADLEDDDTQGILDRLFIETFSEVEPPLRDWIAERPGVHGPKRLRPGIDFRPFGEVADDELWPAGKRFPPPETVEGVQARLNTWGYPAGPVDGEFDERTRRALFRLQLEHGHPAPSGEVDAATKTILRKVKPNE